MSVEVLLQGRNVCECDYNQRQARSSFTRSCGWLPARAFTCAACCSCSATCVQYIRVPECVPLSQASVQGLVLYDGTQVWASTAHATAAPGVVSQSAYRKIRCY